MVKDEIRTIIIVQARMGSKRLPGKILKKVMGRSLLEYQIERLKKVKNANDVVIATTINENDLLIVDLCKELGFNFIRGPEDDVLSRYMEAAIEFDAKFIVRINADCPLIDPNVVEKVIDYYHSNILRYDYVSNILKPSYPIGLHTEMFSLNTLKQAHKNAVEPVEREHVTPYIYRNPEMFKIGSLELNKDLSHHRWTVDYSEDFDLVKKIIEGIYPLKADFDMFDILDFLRSHPELNNINSGITKEQILV
jgi:spore coat polysaccharide biosynthesis protein SpsF